MRNVRILKKERNALLELVRILSYEARENMPPNEHPSSIYAILGIDVRRLCNRRASEYFTWLNEQCTKSEYESIDDRRLGFLVGNIIRKYPFSDPASERARHAETFRLFTCGEDRCRSTNGELSQLSLEDAKTVAEIRSEVIALIGHAPPNDVFRNGLVKHGPGATLGNNVGLDSSSKFAALPYMVSSEALNHLITMITSSPLWILSLVGFIQKKAKTDRLLLTEEAGSLSWIFECFEVVNSNRVTSVPKDTEKNRTIAIEPLGNMLLQLRIDRVLRSRLKRSGYDLNTQVKNQELAREGSRNGSFATIDLSMASDTVSINVIKLLFPEEWSRLILDLRSPTGDLSHFDAGCITYEKLSSMGNGITFMIESVVFLAISRAAMRRNGHRDFGQLAVFGDDIVIPTNSVTQLLLMLKKLGFLVNEGKSFTTGPYRESCGSEWYLGDNMKPVRQKTRLEHFTDLIGLHNRILHWSAQNFGCNLFPKTLSYVISLMPKGSILRGPVDPYNKDGWIQQGIASRRWSGYRYLPALDRRSQASFELLAALCGTADINPRTGKIMGGQYDPTPHRRICERLGLSYNLPLSLSILGEVTRDMLPGFTPVKRMGVWRRRTYRSVSGFPRVDLLSQYQHG